MLERVLEVHPVPLRFQRFAFQAEARKLRRPAAEVVRRGRRSRRESGVDADAEALAVRI